MSFSGRCYHPAVNQQRVSAGLAAVVLLVMSLSGCASNKGSALKAEIEERFTGMDGVADIATTSSNTLPFLGSASAQVTLEDGLSDADITRIVGEAGTFFADIDDSAGDATGVVVVDQVMLDLTADEEARALSVELLAGLRSDEVFDWARVLVWQEGAVRAIEVAPADGVDVASAFHAARALCTAPACDDIVVSAADGGAFGITETEGDREIELHTDFAGDLYEPPVKGDVSGALDVFDAVSGSAKLSGANLSPSAVDLTVEDGADLREARLLARGLAEERGLEASVAGGVLVVVAPGDRAVLDPVVDALLEEEAVLGIDVFHEYVDVEVADVSAGAEVLDALEAVPESAELLDLTLVSGAGRAGMTLSGSVESLRAMLAVAETAPPGSHVELSRETVAQARALGRETPFEAEEQTLRLESLEYVDEVIVAVRPWLVDGDRVEISLRGEASQIVRFDVAPTIEPEPWGPDSDELASLVDAVWNG